MPSKYVLEQELGAGGMGRVYRARLTGEAGFERPVVIKKLLDAGVELRKIRKAIDYLKAQGDAPHGVTLMSDGERIYEAATPEAVVDLLAQGQGVFAIAVDKVWTDLEGSLQKPKTGRRKAAGSA